MNEEYIMLFQMDNLHKEEMIMERIKIDIENLRLGMYRRYTLSSYKQLIITCICIELVPLRTFLGVFI
jgi:hypothetical protein